MGASSAPPAPVFGSNRSRVLVYRTTKMSDYEVMMGKLPPNGVGALKSVSNYTINDDKVTPKPEVALIIGYITDDDQSETIVYTEVIQSIFRDQGKVKTDPDTLQNYAEYTYVVFLYLQTQKEDGTKIDCYKWALDPNFDVTIDPPVDSATGTEGCDVNPLWTPITL